MHIPCDDHELSASMSTLPLSDCSLVQRPITSLLLQIRMALYGMVDSVTSYGPTVGTIVDMVSELRGNVSAMASMTTPPNYADASITIEDVSFLCLQ